MEFNSDKVTTNQQKIEKFDGDEIFVPDAVRDYTVDGMVRKSTAVGRTTAHVTPGT